MKIKRHLKVLLIFCLQGFCLPEEFADEIAGEGSTDFVDIEQGGMGEGEGVKNVSDQIENEDQVNRCIYEKSNIMLLSEQLLIKKAE